MLSSISATFRRMRRGPELTPHQVWRVRKLGEVLADLGGSTDDREAYRGLEDALDIGLRQGLFYAQGPLEIIGLTHRGYRLIGRIEP